MLVWQTPRAKLEVLEWLDGLDRDAVVAIRRAATGDNPIRVCSMLNCGLSPTLRIGFTASILLVLGPWLIDCYMETYISMCIVLFAVVLLTQRLQQGLEILFSHHLGLRKQRTQFTETSVDLLEVANSKPLNHILQLHRTVHDALHVSLFVLHHTLLLIERGNRVNDPLIPRLVLHLAGVDTGAKVEDELMKLSGVVTETSKEGGAVRVTGECTDQPSHAEIT
jgi:hypothetical protein